MPARIARSGPEDPIRSLRRRDRQFIVLLDATMDVAVARSGKALACRVGCTECCMGPFPINALDAVRLREGLLWLEAKSHDRAEAVRARARQAVADMSSDFPGDLDHGIIDDGSPAAVAFYERHAAMPCPALEPATGACELYGARPVSCRTFGPPIQVGPDALPPCHLCFVGAKDWQVERCRVEVDASQTEAVLIEEAEPLAGVDGFTLIAFALAGDESSQLPPPARPHPHAASRTHRSRA